MVHWEKPKTYFLPWAFIWNGLNTADAAAAAILVWINVLRFIFCGGWGDFSWEIKSQPRINANGPEEKGVPQPGVYARRYDLVTPQKGILDIYLRTSALICCWIGFSQSSHLFASIRGLLPVLCVFVVKFSFFGDPVIPQQRAIHWGLLS